MKRGWVFLPAVVMLIGVTAWWCNRPMATVETAPYRLAESEIELLEPGDIILRRGSGIVSDFIANVLKEPYDVSHCGIVAEHDSALWVIHSVSSSLSDFDGMQAHRLQAFVGQSKPGSVVVSRLRTELDRGPIATRAKEYLRRQVPFDHDFDLEDSTTIYCSELVWRILRDDYGVDVFDAHAEGDEVGRYRFARFTDTARFHIILNHQKH
ncbi:MAG: hypothetical protein IPJ85_16550 [Flavobacteriales bacterium]|nr:hypothetical protein [Flavobacteriales bacterium]